MEHVPLPSRVIEIFSTVFLIKKKKKTKKQKKTVFSEKSVKSCFGGLFDHFSGKDGILPQN